MGERMLEARVKDIGQIINKPCGIITIEQTAPVVDAAAKMTDNNVGCLLVLDSAGKPVGILSERDMLAKVLTSKNVLPANVLVRDIMTVQPVFCTLDTPIEEVERLMAEYRVRHIPVIENDVPVDMVSSRDLIAYRLIAHKSMKAAAEQLAMLSTRLKSLHFDDVVALAINDVPESFGATRAMLYFPPAESSPEIIFRNGCAVTPDKLAQLSHIAEASNSPSLINNDICCCKENAGSSHSLFIPLRIHRHTENLNRQPGTTAKDATSRIADVITGFLCLGDIDPGAVASDNPLRYKASLLQELLSANLTTAVLYRSYQQAQRESHTDALTDVGSRRMLEQAMNVECARARRSNHTFSIAIVDLDKFKQINDTAGHATGDKALRIVAKIMRRNVRLTDVVVARYGGDEFVLLMPETNVSQAAILMERLRRQINRVSIPKVGPITISCGVAQWSASPDESPAAIISRADQALYQAKQKGRNRVVISDHHGDFTQTPATHTSA